MAALELPPGLVGRTLGHLRRSEVLTRLGLCALAAIILLLVTRAWAPPLTYHEGQIPDRDILARVDFEKDDPQATAKARDRARALAQWVYDHDPTGLAQLRARLQTTLVKLVASANIDEFGDEAWKAFEPPRKEGDPEPTKEEREEAFTQFRKMLAAEGALDKFKVALAEAFLPFEQRGLLKEAPGEGEGNQEKILVRHKDPGQLEAQPIDDVLIGAAESTLRKGLPEKLGSPEVAQRVFAWLQPQLAATLTLDRDETKRSRDKEAAAVAEKKKQFVAGRDMLAKGGLPLDKTAMMLLDLEHAEFLADQSFSSKFNRVAAVFGMYVALYTLCGFYIIFREPKLVANLPRFVTLLGLTVVTIALAYFVREDPWRAEMIPLLLFGMTVAIAYHQELALLLSAAVALVVVLSIGSGLVDMVILVSALAAAVLMLRNVRSRSKLLYVGIGSGAVVVLTTIGVGIVGGDQFNMGLVMEALRYGFYAVIAGSLMTCLLPFIERIFDVQTDISLIELGDPAHPLLQELVRRAPGTYNHSITVASLAETAAEAIGARSLLCRVGAYFHDIGKMLKPGYFVENQGQGDNRHESLVPAMSTLVIIAHVKDGADLARQHHLPEQIVDFILQHHGTTLVEYFYRRASEQSDANEDAEDVDESSFRYPGPKPQTKETAVLMLSDAVESASRVLVEPTPARIESLVEELVMKRLLDGQFDECGLTLREVHLIQESLVKSLTAVYHGRVKYPGQRTA